jgi:hypothetical protein
MTCFFENDFFFCKTCFFVKLFDLFFFFYYEKAIRLLRSIFMCFTSVKNRCRLFLSLPTAAATAIAAGCCHRCRLPLSSLPAAAVITACCCCHHCLLLLPSLLAAAATTACCRCHHCLLPLSSLPAAAATYCRRRQKSKNKKKTTDFKKKVHSKFEIKFSNWILSFEALDKFLSHSAI